MYTETFSQFKKQLGQLDKWLGMAAEYARSKNFDPDLFATLRLAPDQFPLARQVQIACDTAKGAVARLAGVEIPKHEDTEQTFAELKARIAKTVDFIESVSAAKLDGTEDKEIVLKMRAGDMKFTGLQYLLGFAYPNFYFHLTTAYNILRHNGVDIGKRDFLGG
jgi:hypothetical protein